jgi:hypothetical protein
MAWHPPSDSKSNESKRTKDFELIGECCLIGPRSAAAEDNADEAVPEGGCVGRS